MTGRLSFRLIRFAWLLLGLAVLRPGWAADASPLVFGVFPNLTAKQVIETYRPLADALEKHVQRRVLLYTARDFRTFAMRTSKGEYDLLLTAPHLAWLARQDAGYRPLLQYAKPVRGIAAVKHDAPFMAIGDLRNRTVAAADALAIVTLAMHDEMAVQGLKLDVDYRQLDAGTHSNAALQVITGRADAAIIGMQPYLKLPKSVRGQLRVLAETPPLSSQMFLAHPRVTNAEAEAIRLALLAFAATPRGQTFMQQGGFGSLVAVEGDELRAFRPYALRAQEMLKAVR